MKYKKSIYILIIAVATIVLGNNKVYAALGYDGSTAENVQQATGKKTGNECYYIANGTEEDLYIRITIFKTSNSNGTCGHDYCSEGTIDKIGKNYTSKTAMLANYNSDYKYNKQTISKYSKKSDKCPKYAYSVQDDNYKIYVTDSLSDVENMSSLAKNKKIYLATAYNSDGSKVTEELYNRQFKGTTIDWKEEPISCTDLFGPKKGQPGYEQGLRSLIDEVLGYVRIIVPILIILLGTIDLAKAVIASKEDEMKKAQSTFVKRLIVGVAIFFVPVFVDIIMDLAEIVWAGDYSSCDL